MKTLVLLLSIVIFDACQECNGRGWLFVNRFIPFVGTVCAPGTCPHCHGFKVMPVPPNHPPPDDEWGDEA